MKRSSFALVATLPFAASSPMRRMRTQGTSSKTSCQRSASSRRARRIRPGGYSGHTASQIRSSTRPCLRASGHGQRRP